MGIGEAGNFLSYGFAPASVIAPLGTVALVANCVFAPVVLGESFTRRNVLGMALAILGAVTVVWSSRDDNKRVSSDVGVISMLCCVALRRGQLWDEARGKCAEVDR